jgi:hypothetical protein
MLRRVFIALILLISLFVPLTAAAQPAGSVTGTVADETGGVLPGVTVELTIVGTDRRLEAVTDGTGKYRFDNVPTAAAELTSSDQLRHGASHDCRVVERPVTANAVMFVSTSADIVITASRTFRNLAEIENPAENLVGVASAGSEGAITAAQLAVRPVDRAAEVLETVPGMIISQHSGEGKANQ